MVRKSEVVSALRYAKKLLVTNEWIQGPCIKQKGHRIVGYCAFGAVRHVPALEYDRELETVAGRALARSLPAKEKRLQGDDYTVSVKGDGLGALIRFNERKGRTKKQVIALFDRAIKRVLTPKRRTK